ncbi:guanylate kinase [Taibaiella soli]|uniref:Guanylate kinase n=1 Tax=Taibaiella soli TaxID=1649169 RepID=A0A2W2AP12_9BACT|nr:guanylate kinase [Taibaiella soli]PZF74110.1 guanylate kinase [Taibaiella soli]
MAPEKFIIITAPSGSGKTTLVRRLLAAYPKLAFSISACTRNPRPGEQHGKDYYFYAENDFKNLIDEDAFVEWEMVYTGKYYGTLKSEVQRIWQNDQFPLVDIDVQGALAIQRKYPDSSLSLFIEAPSLEVLRQRLIARGTETAQTLEERIEKAKDELTYAPQFDRIIINDDLEEATRELVKVVEDFLGVPAL